jgi:putative membrane protein
MLLNLFASSVLGLVVRLDQLAEILVTTLIFVIIGLVFFTVAYFILSRIFDIHHEIEEDHNTALGIIIGAIMIGISIIIAAAIHG